MDTSVGYYQAPRPPRVPLDEVLIRLYPEGFQEEEFEADGINVGPGGISMRASVLPSVGATLRCELEGPGGDAPIRMIGAVVWAHDSGPQVGEFGVRFTRLSDDDQSRIEALIQRWGRPSAEAPTVRLQLGGVGSPIVAELCSETEDGLLVAQRLPFLAIGNEVRNEASGRRGHLDAVELKLDEEVPRLVLSIEYEAEGSGDQQDRDTLPEEAPRVSRTNRNAGNVRRHDTPRIVRYDAESEDSLDPTPTRRVRSYARTAGEHMASSLGSMRNVIRKDWIPSTVRAIRTARTVLARFVEALRGRLEDKPRRKQIPRSHAARAHLKNSRRHGRRYLVVAALAGLIAIAGWGIYLWAASGSASAELEKGAPAQSEASEVAAVPPETTPAVDETDSGSNAQVESPAPLPQPPERVQDTSFGVGEVESGETYVLRMSNPVTTMDGLLEDDGFSVIIPGSLSLSRAGPIATAHPDVEHAAIHNRGDFSELTIRFVTGRQPAYRVEARGPAVQIRIER